MCNKKVQVHYYSERGLVNCLVSWLSKQGKAKLSEFFGLLGYSGALSSNYSVELFVEFSFGQGDGFGSPDLIIKLINGATTDIFFIEAKIDTFKNSAAALDKNGNAVYIDNGSKINIQLLLRKNFIKTEESIDDDGNRCIIQIDSKYKNGKKELKKPSMLDIANQLRDNKYNYHYIALVLEENGKKEDKNSIYAKYFPKNENYKIEEEEFVIVTWNEIINKFRVKLDMEYTWEKTFGEGTYPLRAKEKKING